MSRGVNKAIIVGQLGRDPEVRYTASGSAVANFTVATTESWKDKQTGEKKDATEWHNVSVFGHQAEFAGNYLRKGATVYVEGKIQSRKYTDKDGVERQHFGIVASNLIQAGGKREAQEARAEPAGDDFGDDIPF